MSNTIHASNPILVLVVKYIKNIPQIVVKKVLNRLNNPPTNITLIAYKMRLTLSYLLAWDFLEGKKGPRACLQVNLEDGEF